MIKCPTPKENRKVFENEAPRSKLMRYYIGKLFFYSCQGAGNKNYEIPRLSLGKGSAK